MTSKEKMRIVEVTYNWPPEVFIDRHIAAVQEILPGLVVVARHSSPSYNLSASVVSQTSQHGRIMPNYDHLTLSEKLASLRYLIVYPKAFRSKRPIREKVLLAYFGVLNPDLIHFHTLGLAEEMGWIAEDLGIPFTLSLRGSDIQVAPLRTANVKATVEKTLNRASAVHAVSKSLAVLAEETSDHSKVAQVIYTTVPLPTELPIRETRPTGSLLRLLTIGRLVWHKGFPDLIKSLAFLHRQGIQAQLTIIGSGPEEGRLEACSEHYGVNKYIRMVGKADSSAIQNLFSKSDAYVQSSIAEGLGNSLVEAMANGCPVFATDVGGTSEVINDRETGILFSPLQPEMWAEKIAKALDPTLMEKLRKKAYQVAREKFNSQTHAQSFLNFYQLAVNGSSRSPFEGSGKDLPHGELSSVVPEYSPGILVWGAWRWENKTDLLLRGILKIAPSFPDVVWNLVGTGPQEDELRYLAHTFGKGIHINFIPVTSQEMVDQAFRKVWLDPALGMIDLQLKSGWAGLWDDIDPWNEDTWLNDNLTQLALRAGYEGTVR